MTSTPRPWKWEWSAGNAITIYHNEGALHGVEIATLYRADAEDLEAAADTLEADAALIVNAVNAYEEGVGP